MPETQQKKSSEWLLYALLSWRRKERSDWLRGSESVTIEWRRRKLERLWINRVSSPFSIKLYEIKKDIYKIYIKSILNPNIYPSIYVSSRPDCDVSRFGLGEKDVFRRFLENFREFWEKYRIREFGAPDARNRSAVVGQFSENFSESPSLDGPVLDLKPLLLSALVKVIIVI